jgi:two-component system cell cycle sensor histidine kinase/response regulator CckA
MDAATLASCREPFFTTKGSRGIGLGLATVVSIVEQSGGRLVIDSEPGRGTTITAIFPRAQVTTPSRVSGWSHGQARVLLVDDDDLIRRYASHVLTEASYDVTAEGDAESALARLGGVEVFDLLVSDVVLPGMNGFELARAAGARWPDMARLLMTGFTGADTAGTDLADVAVLPKPFSVEELLTAVGNALDFVGQGSKR